MIKDVELIIPQYMTSLPQETVDKLLNEGRKNHIAACGIHPSDKSLCFITVSVDTRIISPNSLYIPVFAKPTNSGEEIEIVFQNIDGSYLINHQIAYDNSESCLELTSIQIDNNYMSRISK